MRPILPLIVLLATVTARTHVGTTVTTQSQSHFTAPMESRQSELSFCHRLSNGLVKATVSVQEEKGNNAEEQ